MWPPHGPLGIVPWGIPRSCATVSDCQGPRGRAHKKPSVWVAKWLASPGPTAWCGVPKALLLQGNGRDVYPRVQVNGGDVCGARAMCKCVVVGGKRGSWGNLHVTLQASVFIPKIPAVLPLSPPARAGVAAATLTPLCCLGLGGLSATWLAPWRGRTRLWWTPR